MLGVRTARLLDKRENGSLDRHSRRYPVGISMMPYHDRLRLEDGSPDFFGYIHHLRLELSYHVAFYEKGYIVWLGPLVDGSFNPFFNV